jgi:xylan 1,4-beta-xylosidase
MGWRPRPGAPAQHPHVCPTGDGDQRNAFIAWDEVPGAVDFNVWGNQPDKLYQTSQIFADHDAKLELGALTMGQDYSVAVEAFNENGLSGLGAVSAIN